MLIELAAENIAIMDKVEVRFGPGLTAITGETGAGKSLLIDAISLCLGERADTGLVRKGATSASVQAVFDPPCSTRALLDELGYSIGDDALFLQRELAVEGKSGCRINGKTAPLSVLKLVGDSLADLHGQHEHQSLLNAATHLGLLDAWIGEKAFEGLRNVATAWQEMTRLKAEIEELQKNVEERERMLDVLRFQVSEIEDIDVKPGEIVELQRELRRLESSESLSAALQSAKESLFNGEISAKDLVSKALHEMEAAAQLDSALEPAVESLRAALIEIDDSSEDVKAGLDRVEYAPERIELIAGRLDECSALKRKYGDSEERILEFLEKARTDLDRLEHMDALCSDAAVRLREAESKYATHANAMSDLRHSRAAKFANLVETELKELGMPAAKFTCEITDKPPGPEGIDLIYLGFSANVGENAMPFSKIASGGEMSRVMLAVKTVMAGKGGIPTLIFDEIDAGLGGQTAAVVAKKLASLGENYQVLVITHVPQIAGRASAQVSIEKESVDGRTVARVRELTPDERVTEIARMVGGEKIEEAAIANAKQLLSD